MPLLQRMGKYRITEEIGRGGMGVVWKGFDPDLHRAVAIKVLAPQLAHSPTSRRRFQREARAAAAISHPNVVVIHSVEEQDGVPYLVMEYVRGQSLKEYLAAKGRLDPLDVIRLGAQVSRGLAAAHAQGVIHRDVKPGNVLLDEGATRAQLTDFGLARAAFDNVDLTSHDQYVGTPAYMSPESLRGDRVDARSDLFSLGCVLYQMLAGHSPFKGRTHGEMIHRILDSEPIRLSDVDPAIPEFLSDIVQQLLHKNPEDRFQSAGEVADLFWRLQHELNQAPTDEVAKIVYAASSARPRKAGLTRKRLWMGAGIALACVVGAALFWQLRGDGDASARQSHPAAADVSPSALSAGKEPTDSALLAAPVRRLKNMIVGSGPEADFATIAEAIRHADVGAEIAVIGPGPFDESAVIDGHHLDGLRLVAAPRAVWRSSGGEHRSLTISDVSDVRIQGFNFEVDSETGRGMHIAGDSRNVVVEDCGFRHMQKRHKLSLMLVSTTPQDGESTVAIRNCWFSAAEGSVMCLGLGSNASAARVECSHCRFTGPNVLVYVTEECRTLVMSHNVFLDGGSAINLSIKDWRPDSRIEIVNNTFVNCRYWIGLMNSFRPNPLPEKQTGSRVCNNLILGGVREQGGEDQWAAVLRAWTFAANWWERGPETSYSAGRYGELAKLFNQLSVAQRENPDAPDFLRPSASSPLLTGGVGGDLPEYIGARPGLTLEQ